MDELRQRATEAATGSGYMTLILPDKRPADFPVSELLGIRAAFEGFNL